MLWARLPYIEQQLTYYIYTSRRKKELHGEHS